MNEIPLFKVKMDPSAGLVVGSTLQSGFIGQGPQVERFEREFEKFSPYPIIATNSCTSAIHAVLMHLGVGPGDEVITTPLTCIATNAPILAVGARPVWADVNRLTGDIDPQDVGTKITKRTKAIIAVNWTGRPANYVALKAYGIPVIEDAAHGPIIRGRETGDFICYSFGPIKHLTCGDGGAIATANAADREALRLLRWYGLDRTSSKDFRCAQDIHKFGLKFHMNDINASIGLSNIAGLEDVVKKHQTNAEWLHNRLRQESFFLHMPYRVKGKISVYIPWFSADSNYWVFPVTVVSQAVRDNLKEFLARRGIASSQVHARNDKHPAYHFPNGLLIGVTTFDCTQLNIPCGWWLKDYELERIAQAIEDFAEGKE